jgi:hypothetical protein
MKYQWVDDERQIVHIIDEDGKSRKSMLVVGRDSVIDDDFLAFQKWIEEGNSILEPS